MWRAINGMSKEVQGLVQRDAGTKDDKETEPTPTIADPATEEPTPTGTSAIAPPFTEETNPTRSSFSFIPKEDVVSVKDSVTSGLPAHGSLREMEVGGSSRHSMTLSFKFTRGHVAEKGSTDDVEKMALVPPKEEKGSY